MKLVNLSFQQTAVLPEHVRFSEKFETLSSIRSLFMVMLSLGVQKYPLQDDDHTLHGNHWLGGGSSR